MKKLTHEADGLYYLSYNRLMRHYPHLPHRRLWRYKFGLVKVPVTLQLLAGFERTFNNTDNGSFCYWLLATLLEIQKTTPAEFYALASTDFWHVSPLGRAQRVMAALALRADREGRLK